MAKAQCIFYLDERIKTVLQRKALELGPDWSMTRIVSELLVKAFNIDLSDAEENKEPEFLSRIKSDPLVEAGVLSGSNNPSEGIDHLDEDPPKEDMVQALVEYMIERGWSWNLLQVSIDDSPSRYHLYKEEVKKRVEALGKEFIETNIEV